MKNKFTVKVSGFLVSDFFKTGHICKAKVIKGIPDNSILRYIDYDPRNDIITMYFQGESDELTQDELTQFEELGVAFEEI